MELAGDRVGFFEMVPMQELQVSLRQALHYVLNIMVTHYDSFVPFRYHTREIVLAIEICLQTVYLTKSKATYAETFYKLKRSYVGKNGLKELSTGLVIASVFMEAILPYIKGKLEQKESRIARLLVRIMNLLKFAFMMQYLVTDSLFFKPYLKVFGILVRR